MVRKSESEFAKRPIQDRLTQEILAKITDQRPFFRLFSYFPHKGQWKAHNSPAKFKCIVCGRRWGKSTFAAGELAAHMMMPGEVKMYWNLAPVGETALKVYRMARFMFLKHYPEIVLDDREHKKILVVRNLGGGVSQLHAKSGESPDSLIGEGLDGIVIDEAARMKRVIWDEYVRPALADKNGWAILISTPRGKNWFYEKFKLGEKKLQGWESFTQPSWINPKMIGKKAEIEAEYYNNPKVPIRVYEQEYLARFVEGGGSVFVNVDEISTVEAWDEPRPGMMYFMGIDLARDLDFSAIHVIDMTGKTVFCDRWSRIDWPEQEKRIYRIWDKWRKPYVVMDTTRDSPVASNLRRMGMNVNDEFYFTQTTKTQLYENAQIMCERNTVQIPTRALFAALYDEMMEIEYATSEQGKVTIGAPRGGTDDSVTAFALSIWPMKTRPWAAPKEKSVEELTYARKMDMMLQREKYQMRSNVLPKPHPFLKGFIDG